MAAAWTLERLLLQQVELLFGRNRAAYGGLYMMAFFSGLRMFLKPTITESLKLFHVVRIVAQIHTQITHASAIADKA